MGATRSKLRDWPVFRIGLTGGIASGKTTVANWFAALGVPVVDTDVIAREVVAPGTPGLRDVVAEFGAGVLLPDGSLDRRRLRDLAFTTEVRRRRLEALLHPRILASMEAQSAAAGGPYQVLVVPLLVESGLDTRMDRVLVVDCSETVQRQRLMARDGETGPGVDRLLAAQMDRQARRSRADDLLTNDGPRDEVHRRVTELHANYLQLAEALKRGGMQELG